MRDIRFRAWDKGNMKMIDGVIPVKIQNDLPYMIWGNGINYTGTYGDQYTMETFIQLGDFEIMQYTGLKDRHGKEIYEGDLMGLDDEKGNRKFTYVVVFEDAKFVCHHVIKEYGKWGDLCRAFDPDFAPYNFHVIGNIHEHPELLK